MLSGNNISPDFIDSIADGQKFIDTVHHRIHAGVFFTANGFLDAVVDDGTLEGLVIVPAGSGAHMRIVPAGGGDSLITLFEGPTVSANGAALTMANRNRRSSITAEIEVYQEPTTTDDGTAIDGPMLAPGGTGGASPGAQTAFFQEWILDASQSYLLRVQNIAGNAQPLAFQLDWYEPGQESG